MEAGGKDCEEETLQTAFKKLRVDAERWKTVTLTLLLLFWDASLLDSRTVHAVLWLHQGLLGLSRLEKFWKNCQSVHVCLLCLLLQRTWSCECFRGVGSQSSIATLSRRQRSEAQTQLPQGQLARVGCFNFDTWSRVCHFYCNVLMEIVSRHFDAVKSTVRKEISYIQILN